MAVLDDPCLTPENVVPFEVEAAISKMQCKHCAYGGLSVLFLMHVGLARELLMLLIG